MLEIDHDLPVVSDLESCAILLDVDGTILDIAPTPDAVMVPDELRHTLELLLEKTSGAMALVSGRSIEDLDRIFQPLKFPAVGCHGAQLRTAPASSIHSKAPLPDEVKRCLTVLADPARGIILEDKTYTLAVHYRMAPDEKTRLEKAVYACVAHIDPQKIEILNGKAVFEIKPSQFDKGTAVLELMQRPPFHGRIPIFIGDDVTDEAAFAALKVFGGMGVAVGRQMKGADHIFAAPEDVRRWLASIAGLAQQDIHTNGTIAGGTS